MSSIVNKVKEVLHGDKTSAPEGTHGPHGSRTANAVDPRVDSDRDGSHTVGNTTGRTAGHGELGSVTGSTGVGFEGGAREGDYGPHGSRVANAVDPRVDSDRDGSRTVGNNQYSGTSGTTGTGFGSSNNQYSGTTGSTGLGSSNNQYSSGAREGEFGPHGSRVANAVDPRVDSDLDGSRTAGNTTGAGYSSGNTTGAGYSSGNTGFNQGYSGVGGTGPAPNTAGPHGSDVLNKVDPRVDSDLDGSKTVGGNRTFQ